VWRCHDAMRRLARFFDAYRLGWFALFNYAAAVTLGALGGASVMCSAPGCCAGVAGGVVAVAALHFVVLVVARPTLTRLDAFLELVASGSTLVVAAIALAIVLGNKSLSDALERVLVALVGLAYAQLVLLALPLLRIAWRIAKRQISRLARLGKKRGRVHRERDRAVDAAQPEAARRGAMARRAIDAPATSLATELLARRGTAADTRMAVDGTAAADRATRRGGGGDRSSARGVRANLAQMMAEAGSAPDVLSLAPRVATATGRLPPSAAPERADAALAGPARDTTLQARVPLRDDDDDEPPAPHPRRTSQRHAPTPARSALQGTAESATAQARNETRTHPTPHAAAAPHDSERGGGGNTLSGAHRRTTLAQLVTAADDHEPSTRTTAAVSEPMRSDVAASRARPAAAALAVSSTVPVPAPPMVARAHDDAFAAAPAQLLVSPSAFSTPLMSDDGEDDGDGDEALLGEPLDADAMERLLGVPAPRPT
jgi:hypothetical protein